MRREATRHRGQAAELTLLDLFDALHEVTDDDREAVAAVLHLLASGRLRSRRRGAVVVAA